MKLSPFGFIVLPFCIALIILSYIFGTKPYKKGERCTQKTTGIVIGPSHIYYGDVCIPLIKYSVDDVFYRVAGPRFKSAISKNYHSPTNEIVAQHGTNLTSQENLPEKLIIDTTHNSFININESPLMKLFPVGTKVDVYYNPMRPKESYVIRDCPPPVWMRYVLYGLTIFTIGLTIRMFTL